MSCNQEIRDSNAATTATAGEDSALSSSAKENINTMEPSAEKDRTTATTAGNNEETKEESTNSLSLLEEGKRMIAYPTVRGSIRDKKKTSEKLLGIPGTNTTNVSHQYHSQAPSEVESKLLRDAKLTVQYPAAHRKLTAKDSMQNKGSATDSIPTRTTTECMPEPERISVDSGMLKKDHNRIIVSPRNVHNSKILRHTKELVPYPTCSKGGLPPPEQNTIPTPADTAESYPDTSSCAHVQEVSFPRPSENRLTPYLQGSEILHTVDYPACRNEVITTTGTNAYPSDGSEADVALQLTQVEEEEEEDVDPVEVGTTPQVDSDSSNTGGDDEQRTSAGLVVESNPNSGCLAVARQVTGESSRPLNLPHARPYREESTPSQKEEEDREMRLSKKKSIALLVASGITISLTVILISVFLLGKHSEDYKSEQSETTPSQILRGLLPSYTLESLEDINSPQSKAFNWTINDPNFDTYHTYQPWRLKQRFSLATLYYSTGGDSWAGGSQESNFKPWLDYERHECEWYAAITCRSVALILGNEITLITGNEGLPLHLLDQFANACVLNTPCDGQDLEDNNQGKYKILSRAMGGGGTIPPEIAMLTSLWGIAFAFADIHGSIPTEVALMTSLQALFLYSNGVGGSIPTQIGMATDLKFLIVYEEPSLSGALPTEVGLLSNLTILVFENTAIGGSIPYELRWLSRLETLSLSGSNLGGSIPSELGQLSELTHLWIWDNGFVGEVPSQLGLNSRLETLSLNMNSLTGTIPTEVGHLSRMKEMRLYSNELTGVLPSQLGLLTNAIVLELYDNQLVGQIPPELGLMTSLTRLQLDYNRLLGQIPSDFGLMSQLATLSVSSNDIHWLPSELGLLSQLTSLYASSNRVQLLPSELGLLSQLIVLDLSDNYIRGAIKSELGQLSRLETLRLQSNRFSGNVPPEFAELQDLERLTLDNNELTGKIPDELISLRGNGSLTLLTLANNSFSGMIPERLCSLGSFDDADNYENYYNGLGISFDCSEQLCGCCWCPCSANDTGAYCQTNPIYINNAEWPGQFPTLSNAIVINIRTNRHHYRINFEWSKQAESGLWEVIESRRPADPEHIHSYPMEVQSDSLYKLRIFDGFGNGVIYEHGWFTITNSTPSQNHVDGTVIWDAAGNTFKTSLDAYIWIDQAGHSHNVAYIPGVGYALEAQGVVVPEKASFNSSVGVTTNLP